MAVYLNCPYCGDEHRLHLKYAAFEVVCPSCRRSFIPVAHTGVPCPKCGSVVLTAPGCTDTRPVCLECGHHFSRPGNKKRLLVTLSASVFILVALVIIIDKTLT